MRCSLEECHRQISGYVGWAARFPRNLEKYSILIRSLHPAGTEHARRLYLSRSKTRLCTFSPRFELKLKGLSI